MAPSGSSNWFGILSDPRTRSRVAGALLLIALAVYGVAYVSFTASELPGSISSDSASYMLIARSFSPYRPPSEAVEEAAVRNGYPPFFPWVSAVTGLAYDIESHFVLNAVFLIAALWLLHSYLSTQAGSQVTAFAVVLTVMSLPGTWISGLEIGSEPLYLLLSVLALYLLDGKRARPVWGVCVLAGVVLGALALTRTIGISLAAAAVVVGALSRSGRGSGSWKPYLAPLLALAFLLGWAAVAPEYDRTYLSAFTPVVLATLGVDNGFVDLFTVAGATLQAFPVALKEYLFWFPLSARLDGLAWALTGLFLVSAVAGLLLRLRERRLDGVYVVLYFLIVLSWPYPGEMYRFLFPVMPLLVFHAAHFVTLVGRRVMGSPYLRALAALPVALFLALCVIASIGVHARTSRAPEEYRHSTELYTVGDEAVGLFRAMGMKETMKDMVRVGQSTETDALIASPKAGFMTLLSSRRAVELPTFQTADRYYCDFLQGGVDYVYVGRLTTDGNREGLGALDNFHGLARVQWSRQDAEGRINSALLRLDRSALVERLRKADGAVGCNSPGGESSDSHGVASSVDGAP